MEHYAGIDLHSTNSYIGIIDKDNKRIYKAKAKNSFMSMSRATSYKRPSSDKPASTVFMCIP